MSITKQDIILAWMFFKEFMKETFGSRPEFHSEEAGE